LSAADRIEELTLLLITTAPEALLTAGLLRRADEARRREDSGSSQTAATRPDIRGPLDEERLADNVDQFCQRYNISRSALYDLWRRGEGPRFFKVGAGGGKRISRQAGAEWVAQREAEATS
jgi:hypothetical protein